MNRIQNTESDWIEDQEAIVLAAIEFYNGQFTKQEGLTNMDILEALPPIITEEENNLMHEVPTKE